MSDIRDQAIEAALDPVIEGAKQIVAAMIGTAPSDVAVSIVVRAKIRPGVDILVRTDDSMAHASCRQASIRILEREIDGQV